MATTNENNLDAGSRFWADDHSGSSYKAPETQREDVDADTTLAFREVERGAAQAADIRAKSDSRAYLRHHHGSTKNGLERADQWQDAAAVDPINTIEAWRRDKARRLSTPMPERPRDEQRPDYLDEKGGREWDLLQDVKRGVRDAPAERADAEDIEDALPTIARLKEKYGRPAGDLIERIAGVEMAGDISNGKIADKLFAMATGGLTPEQYVQKQHTDQVEAQETQRIAGVIDYVTQSGTCPGMETQAVRSKMAQAIRDQRVPTTGDDMRDLFNAYNTVAADARRQHWFYNEVIPSGRFPGLEREDIRHKVAEVVGAPNFQSSGDDLTDLTYGYNVVAAEMQEARQREAAEKARHASRSISGSPGSSVSESDYGDGSVEDAARAAWRSVTNSTYV
jgi:hypothetical protein